MRRLVVDAFAPDPRLLQEAASIIEAGGVVAVPTDTLYGLAADPFREDAVARVFAIKGRAAERALPLIAADLEQVERRIGILRPLARTLATRFWPGPLTILVPAPGTLAAKVSGGTGTVGIRVPAHAVARALCQLCGSPLTATSANASGGPAPSDPNEVARSLGDRIDVLLDAGPTMGGPPSTIVDTTGSSLRLVRAGAIAWSEICA
jgi:L-threonylcarbamoyladenylate synthase